MAHDMAGFVGHLHDACGVADLAASGKLLALGHQPLKLVLRAMQDEGDIRIHLG